MKRFWDKNKEYQNGELKEYKIRSEQPFLVRRKTAQNNLTERIKKVYYNRALIKKF